MLTAEEDSVKIKEDQLVYEMRQDNSCECEVENRFCVYEVYHFCSNCLVKNATKNLPDRIVALRFSPKSYHSLYNIENEVCFCYDTEYCKSVSLINNNICGLCAETYNSCTHQNITQLTNLSFFFYIVITARMHKR